LSVLKLSHKDGIDIEVLHLDVAKNLQRISTVCLYVSSQFVVLQFYRNSKQSKRPQTNVNLHI